MCAFESIDRSGHELNRPDQERDSFAALRQNHPEAAFRNGLKSKNPNRSFAALVSDVSVAGQRRRDFRRRASSEQQRD